MDIIIGRGNSRAKFVIATGREMKALAKTNPIEHTKIVGNLKALVRQQAPVRVKGRVAKALSNA